MTKMPSIATLLSALALPLLATAAPTKDHTKCPKGLVTANGATFQQNGKNEYFAGTNVSPVPGRLDSPLTSAFRHLSGILARPATPAERA